MKNYSAFVRPILLIHDLFNFTGTLYPSCCHIVYISVFYLNKDESFVSRRFFRWRVVYGIICTAAFELMTWMCFACFAFITGSLCVCGGGGGVGARKIIIRKSARQKGCLLGGIFILRRCLLKGYLNFLESLRIRFGGLYSSYATTCSERS